MDADLPYMVGFSRFPGIGPARFKLLYDYFGSAKSAWNASVSELKHLKLGDALSEQFGAFRKTIDLDSVLFDLAKLHIVPLSITDPKYPSLLREISDPPFVLYVLGKKGSAPIDMKHTLAVVGTRDITAYGKEVTERLVTELVQSGMTIVSGLARGVDAAAHWAAIEARGKTIAVLGCGIDIIAPSSNARLYREIAGGKGAIVSEMPLGHRPLKGLFPARNRIISGLSLGTLVIEGADDSGALITARYCGEQGREVFAVPGAITSRYSKATARLIKNGAKLVESASDIIEELGIDAAKGKGFRTGDRPGVLGETPEEQAILEIVSAESKHIDDIMRASGLTAQSVAAILTVLEIRGVVKDYGEKTYGLIRY